MSERLDVHQIVEKYLTDNGFDGLYNDSECGCDIGDLAPCGEIGGNCIAGYKVFAPEGKGDPSFCFYIVHDKNDVPWDE